MPGFSHIKLVIQIDDNNERPTTHRISSNGSLESPAGTAVRSVLSRLRTFVVAAGSIVLSVSAIGARFKFARMNLDGCTLANAFVANSTFATRPLPTVAWRTYVFPPWMELSYNIYTHRHTHVAAS